MKFCQRDVFDADLGKRYFKLVYADPPYAACRFNYARHLPRPSRQWGINVRADFWRELIAKMEVWRASDGVCAVSMGTPELRLLPLFPSKHRVLAWTKPYAPHRPGVWPTFAWEPVVAWGVFPNRDEQRSAPKTPHDWLLLSPRVPKKAAGSHENPKPAAFGEWILNELLGPRRGPVLELFAGTAPVARAAEKLELEAWAVDIKRYED